MTSNHGMRTTLPAPGGDRLFNPATVEPKKCTAKGCPGKASLCRHDADREAGEPVGKRPRTCLNSYDPATAQTPY